MIDNLSDARVFFSSKISKDLPGIIAGQIVSNIDWILSDDTKSVQSQRDAAQAQLAKNIKRYADAKAEASALTTTE